MEGMAIPEQFSLRWNDFYSNLSQSFQSFLAGEDLVDVTLAVDGQYVHAHKLILSVCSPYFKELFKMNPCEHPIVFLKDVTRHELHQLIQFMYRGEVHVHQQELSGFLHTAELLQVKGLTGSRERSESPQQLLEESPAEVKVKSDPNVDWSPNVDDSVVSEPANESHAVPTLKEEPSRSPLKRLLKDTPNKNNYSNKKKTRNPLNDNIVLPENSDYTSDSEPIMDFDNDLKLLHHHSVLVVPKKEGWNCKTNGVKCPNCHRIFANRYNLKVHIRDKHDTREGTLQCEICQKRMRNPSCLRVHMYHHRKQAAYLAQIGAPGDLGQLYGMKAEWRTDGQPVPIDYTEKSQGGNGDWRPEDQAGGGSDFSDKVQLGMKAEWRQFAQTPVSDCNDNAPASSPVSEPASTAPETAFEST